jgi:hypothetical protein
MLRRLVSRAQASLARPRRDLREHRPCPVGLAHRAEGVENRERGRELALGTFSLAATEHLRKQEPRPRFLPPRSEVRESVRGPNEEGRGTPEIASSGGSPPLEPIRIERQCELLADFRLLVCRAALRGARTRAPQIVSRG